MKASSSSPSKATATPNYSHGKRCNKCGYFAVFILLATLAHLTLFSRLHVVNTSNVDSELWLLSPQQLQQQQQQHNVTTNRSQGEGHLLQRDFRSQPDHTLGNSSSLRSEAATKAISSPESLEEFDRFEQQLDNNSLLVSSTSSEDESQLTRPPQGQPEESISSVETRRNPFNNENSSNNDNNDISDESSTDSSPPPLPPTTMNQFEPLDNRSLPVLSSPEDESQLTRPPQEQPEEASSVETEKNPFNNSSMDDNENNSNNDNSDISDERSPDISTTANFFNSLPPSPPPKKYKWVYNRTAWRPRPNDYFTVPFPVFVASLPKSGTTSIYAYFLCGGVRSVHTFCPYDLDPKVKGQMRVGTLIEENIKNGYPPFHGCGTGVRERHGPVNVFSDTGFVPPGGPCYYPSISALEAMYEHYPNMTIVLGTRNSTKWYQSISQWARGDLVVRWTKYCSFMPDTVNPDAFIEFYEWHNRHIRKFAKRRPSITLLEFEIDSPNAGEYLESATNISADCWGHSRPVDATIAWDKGGKKKKKKNNNRQRQNLAMQRQIARTILIKGASTMEAKQKEVRN